MDQADNNFIDPVHRRPRPVTINRVAVIYPAQFFPVFGSTTFDDSVAVGRANLSHCLGASLGVCNYNTGVGSAAPNPKTDHFIVFGYSQSAVVASLVKNDLINDPTPDPALDGTEFFMAANPMRPNGGILGRGFEGLTIPIIGITFYGPTKNSCPTATPCSPRGPGIDGNVYPTVDVAQQYDLLGGDAPAVPYNILAWANSLAAYALLHGQVPTHSLDDSDVVYQGAYGDTKYYMIDSDLLPILMVAEQAGVPRPILAFANAPLQVLVESAYYRDISPGEHVGFQLLPSSDPITLTVNLVKSIPVGIDDGLDEAGLGRVLGTTEAGLYGVGGPATPPEPIAVTTVLRSSRCRPGRGRLRRRRLKGLWSIRRRTMTHNSSSPRISPSWIWTHPTRTRLQRAKSRVRSSCCAARSSSTAPKRPSAVRPNGDGPLKRIVNALTGQRPKAEVTPSPATIRNRRISRHKA